MSMHDALVEQPVPLVPLKDRWVTGLLQDTTLMSGAVERFGSPLNVHNTSPFSDNVKDYQDVFSKYGLKGRVFFARKANKCLGFVQASKNMSIGVDTASFNELKQAIACGVPAKDLVLTAAIKNKQLLELAVAHDVLIILDNSDECDLLQGVCQAQRKQARVGLRISGFHFQGEKSYSRFGFDIDQVEEYVRDCFHHDQKYPSFQYEGLHFHLNGYSVEERAAALSQCVELAGILEMYRLKTSFIDIGGGLLINYLADHHQWESFKSQLKSAVKGERDAITFDNNGLGYRLEQDQLVGRLNAYPYFNTHYKSLFLQEIFEQEVAGFENLADQIRTLNIEIRIEPGRSLLDQAGFTVAKVAYRKRDSQGNYLVGLEMNMTQMHSSSADFLLDPEVIYLSDEDVDDEAQDVPVYFTGAYCLERDMLLKRQIHLPKLPSVGDLVVFFNTAGYMMHFFESEAHQFDLAANVFYDVEASAFKLDSYDRT